MGDCFLKTNQRFCRIILDSSRPCPSRARIRTVFRIGGQDLIELGDRGGIVLRLAQFQALLKAIIHRNVLILNLSGLSHKLIGSPPAP